MFYNSSHHTTTSTCEIVTVKEIKHLTVVDVERYTKLVGLDILDEPIIKDDNHGATLQGIELALESWGKEDFKQKQEKGFQPVPSLNTLIIDHVHSTIAQDYPVSKFSSLKTIILDSPCRLFQHDTGAA
ncbi:hypothetical protein MBANPS3_000419 [Mucor bainieri]